MNFYISYYTTDANGKMTMNYAKVVGPSNAVSLTVLAVKDDHLKALNQCMWFAQENGVPYFPTVKKKRDKAIICQETGEVFETMVDAIAKNGGNAPTMSNHLKGRSGYKTVNGFTYAPYVE